MRAKWIPPAERPLASFEVVRKHPWFQKLHWNEMLREMEQGIKFEWSLPRQREFYESLKPVIEIIPDSTTARQKTKIVKYCKPSTIQKVAHFFGFTYRKKKPIGS